VQSGGKHTIYYYSLPIKFLIKTLISISRFRGFFANNSRMEQDIVNLKSTLKQHTSLTWPFNLVGLYFGQLTKSYFFVTYRSFDSPHINFSNDCILVLSGSAPSKILSLLQGDDTLANHPSSVAQLPLTIFLGRKTKICQNVSANSSVGRTNPKFYTWCMVLKCHEIG